ncbi:SNR48 protein, partial [Acromyrmex insinuator]
MGDRIEMNMLKNINDSREQQLEKLKNFTDTINEEITNIVGMLGWTMESIMDVDKEYFICPYDPSHRLTEASLNDHLVSCQWKAEGYGKLDVPLSEPTLPEDSPFCIKFETFIVLSFMIVLLQLYEKNKFLTLIIGMGERLVPRTSDRIVIDFTSDERKALYDYVIANTAKPDIGEDITNINNLEPQEKEDKKLSFLELLIQERNLKRRRVKHKGVHTNKRSYIEILREVINQQMEIFVDYVSEQSNSGHVTDVRNTETDDLNYEQDRTERLYKVFHSSRNNDEYNSREKNGHHHKKKREHSEERNYHRSRERDRQKRYSDETDRKHKHEHRNTEISSHSREQKSHKKDKYQNKDKHKNKYHEKKHKSGDRDKSSERHSKHSDHKRARKNKNKEY